MEYDPSTDRFVGFCMPLKDGLPICNAFILNTFEEIKEAVENKTISKYAHCIVAQPVDGIAPASILLVLGTDSKYTHELIIERWNFIEKELLKRDIKVISNGADGAGPFTKAMLSKSGLLTKTSGDVPPTWTFYIMPSLHESSLSAQDNVHLLAKMRNRLSTPSNLLTMGSEVACRAHLFHVLITFNKSKHGLTQKAINNKDKQNYSSIALLVEQKVEACLQESMLVMKTKGTIVYSSLMRRISEIAFSISRCLLINVCI